MKFRSKFIIGFICLFGSLTVTAQKNHHPLNQNNRVQVQDTLSWSVSLLNKILNSGGEWYISDNSLVKPVKGVLNYAENEPIDSSVVDVRRILSDEQRVYLFERRPQDIRDRSKVPGYISEEEELKRLEKRKLNVSDSLRKINIQLPQGLLDDALKDAPLIPQGNTQDLVYQIDYIFPSSFKRKFYRNYSTFPFPSNMTGSDMDSLQRKVFDWSRQAYNDSIVSRKSDSLLVLYREQYIADVAGKEAEKLKKEIEARNRKALTLYNDSEVGRVNDSIRVALDYLASYAAADSALVRLTNISGEESKIWTANHGMYPIRTYLKNAQNDSLGVIVYNNGKGNLKLVIDDGVKFMRFTESQKREITFEQKEPDRKNLLKMDIKKPEALAWNLFGNGTVGFTQTALANWSKGGESSMALLFVGKYNANYSKKKLKWENSAEFRYGVNWTKARGFQKNDDKIELQSRIGYSAFKKWYYSAETNFRTQIARGFKYPNMDDPISTYMAPGYLTFSLGLDYKPNKNFSLFLSPLSSKTTYVLDNVLIDPTTFGLEPGQKKLWEPGLIVKTNWKTKIVENINYETRGELFNNYRYPFKKVTFDWEQLLIMQVTQYISTRIMAQTIYDYNTKFPIKDSTGAEIGRKAKWQFKELFTIGFSYKF